MVDVSATTVEPAVLAEIACLASNFSERQRIVERLAARRAPRRTPPKPRRVRGLESPPAFGETRRPEPQRLAPPRGRRGHQAPEIEATLRDFALYLQNLPQFSDGDRQEVLAPHAAWLGTYGKALAAMALPRETFDDCRWRIPRSTTAHTARSASPSCDSSSGTRRRDAPGRPDRPILPVFAAGRGQCRAPLAEPVGARPGLGTGNRYQRLLRPEHDRRSHEDPSAFAAYMHATFTDASSYRRFYCKFPVLGRWLAQLTALERSPRGTWSGAWSRTAMSYRPTSSEAVLLRRSGRCGWENRTATRGDRAWCSSIWSWRAPILRRLFTNHGASSPNQRCRACCPGCPVRRSFRLRRSRCSARTTTATPSLSPRGRNQVKDEATVERLYRQLGGYLAVFTILGGTDLHFENILVADGNAFICDCETILSVTPEGMDVHVESVGESVFRTGMLEWPRPEITGPDNALKISGYSGGESYEVPFAVPRINESRTSLGLRVEYLRGVKVEQSPPNRILYQGRVVDPGPYKSCILDGFNSVYGWFERQPGAASACVNDLFAGASVRFVNRGTQAYAHLLTAVRHPKCLSDPVEVDLIYNIMRFHHREWDTRRALAAREIEALWLLDVPIFTAKADGRTLVSDHRDATPVGLACSPLENADRRIQGLSRDNRIRQNQYIGAGLSTNEIKSPTSSRRPKTTRGKLATTFTN